MLNDYRELIWEPQWKWLKKYWKGYLVFLAIYSAVVIGVAYFDDIKQYIQSKRKIKRKES